MPTPASEDDLKRRARRRLIGAVALTLIAIIVLPLLLENEPPPAGRLEVHMPPVASLPRPVEPNQVETEQIQPEQVELAPAPPSPPVSVPTVAEPTASSAHKPALPDKPKPKPKVLAEHVLAEHEVKPKPKPNAPFKPESKKHSVEKPVDKALSTTFVVQLGAFSDPTKTAALKSRAADLGLATFIDKSGALTRLRVGPFSSRAAALEAAAQLAEAGMSGQVMAK